MTDVSETERLTKVEGQVAQLTANVSQLSADVRLILDRIGAVGKPNWLLIISALAVLITIVATSASCFYLFTTLQTQSVVSGLKSEYIAPLDAKAEISIRDRGEIRAAIREIQQQLSEVDARERAATAKLDERTVEQESQFRSSDQYHNVQWANTLRFISLLWEKAYGEKFPSEVQYYPQIAQPPR